MLMTSDNNSAVANGFQSEIDMISGKFYGSPDECISALTGITTHFRKVAEENIRCKEIPNTLKDNIYTLIDNSTAIVDYDIDCDSPECYCCDKDFNITVRSLLTVRSTAEDLAAQVDEFCDQAVMSLSDHTVLNKNITPTFMLKNIVDTYALERGVDEREEIDHIVSRLVKRYFTDAQPASEMCPCTDDYDREFADIPWLTAAIENVSQWQTFNKLSENFALLQRSIVRTIYKTGQAQNIPNLDKITKFARWFSFPNVIIKVRQEENGPIIDFEKKEVRIPFPTMLYAIALDQPRLLDYIRKIWRIIQGSYTDSVLKTDSLSLKRDLQEICDKPAQDIGPLLLGAVIRNFDVRLIEIHDEDDQYATPEYFEASRANNVKNVTTTKPAVGGREGKIISKGIYVGPLEDSVKTAPQSLDGNVISKVIYPKSLDNPEPTDSI